MIANQAAARRCNTTSKSTTNCDEWRSNGSSRFSKSIITSLESVS